MTGLTDNMRANFNLMKSINQVLQRGAADRLKDIVQFVNDLTAQPKVQELIKPWGVQLKPDPLKVQAQMIPAGQVLMGGNIKFDCQINGR
jgi:aubergine-like protein